MARQHPQWDFYAGDLWRINATILDDSGNPLDITSLINEGKVEWALVGPNGNLVITPDQVTFDPIDTSIGKTWIDVNFGVTQAIAPGRYEDVLRVVMPNGPRTKWTGAVFVHRGMPAS